MAKFEGIRSGVAALLLAASPAVAATHEHPPVRRLLVHPRLFRPAGATLGVAVAPGVTFDTKRQTC